MSGLDSVRDDQLFAIRKKYLLCTLTSLINYKACVNKWADAGIMYLNSCS